MGVPIADGERADRLAWRLAFSTFAVGEAEKPAQVRTAGEKVTVKAGGKEATLSPSDFVEAVSGRLKTIDQELQDALRALA
jgi:hypothetical protein